MKKLFGKPKMKRDGTPGKAIVMPSVEDMQQESHLRPRWIHYSAKDAKATYDLYCRLKERLHEEGSFKCVMDRSVRSCYEDVKTLWDFYCAVWKPFGELLTDMEDVGFYVNTKHLQEAQQSAEQDRDEAVLRFRTWAESCVPGAAHMNPGSDAQIRTMLFSGIENTKARIRRERIERNKARTYRGLPNGIEDQNGESGTEKSSGVEEKKTEVFVPFTRTIKIVNPDYELYIKGKELEKQKGKEPAKKSDKKPDEKPAKKPRRMLEVTLHGMWGEREKCPLKPEIFTAAGWPAVSAAALKTLIGKPGAAREILEKEYGVEVKGTISDLPTNDETHSLEETVPPPEKEPSEEAVVPTETEIIFHRKRVAADKGLGQLYTAFEDPRKGLEACVAVEALVEISTIETLLASFILPLQEDNIKTRDGRIHGSMNINTETGRLSCRRPNLQNQPSLEKDRYKVRQSFRAVEGKTLIVADYGQLELRVLAHLTRCQSMIEAFERGGDFHSRTAAGMYDHIKQEIESGRVALEKGESEGEDIPLVKDVYSSERRKAKILNFSIAYGKTPHGLAKDWNVGIQEAEKTVERWYADRQEVKEWQEATIEDGKKCGYVTTLLGRRRNLPDLRSRDRIRYGHAERAAINTPIQGSAADIVTAAMLAIRNNERLRELGFQLLSQIHDEVILEGPKEHAEEAQSIVVECMGHPFPHPSGGYCNPLQVELTVDSKYADTWYDAK